MKAIMIIAGLIVSNSCLCQQRMISFDTSGDSIVQTSDDTLSNIISMSSKYDEKTTEILLFTEYVDSRKVLSRYLVEGITTTDSFKVYKLKREDVTFEVVIGETYFILQYEDHYDVFPQKNSQQ